MCFQIAVALFLSLLIYFKYTNRCNSQTKGYVGMPILGLLYHFIFQKNFNQTLQGIACKFGKICYVKLGSYNVVMLNDHEVIREAFQNPAFAGRSLLQGVLDRTFGFRGGLIFNDGPSLIEQQKFTKKTLKEFGFGRPLMEDLILQEALELVAGFRRTNQEAISTEHRFNIASLNTFCVIVTGERLDYDDPKILQLINVLNKNFELGDGAIVGFLIPWLARWVPNLIGWNKYKSEAQEIFKFWRNFAEERIQKNLSSCPDNFLDAYIQKIHETADVTSSFYGNNGVKSLATTLQDLFVAGTETTAATLNWIFYFLAAHLEIQDQMFDHIESVLGSGEYKSLPKISDKFRLPFIEAVIMESMRLGTIAPIGLAHRAMEYIDFHGLKIPKDTLVHSNIIAVHLNAELWGDPNNFRPSRFLSPDGGKILNFKYFLPFSHGKRKCPGEALARDELFLFVTCIMQEFKVKFPKDLNVTFRPKVGISAVPQKHSLIFEPRSS